MKRNANKTKAWKPILTPQIKNVIKINKFLSTSPTTTLVIDNSIIDNSIYMRFEINYLLCLVVSWVPWYLCNIVIEIVIIIIIIHVPRNMHLDVGILKKTVWFQKYQNPYAV